MPTSTAVGASHLGGSDQGGSDQGGSDHGGSAPPGLVLAPFRALRYAAAGDDLAVMTSPPYDVIDENQRIQLEAASPHNVVRLILPRDDAGPGSRYRRAAATLRAWRRSGVLRRDPEPALYVYQESVDGHVQRGLLGALGLTPIEAGIVLPHENTMAGPVADRLALTEATSANLEPIFLVYEGGGPASELVRSAEKADPLVSIATDDGVEHRLWRVTEPAEIAAAQADLLPRRAVIADGHHRYATYLRHQQDRHRAGDGPGPWDSGLAYLVDSAAFGPQVHAIHRTVAGLPVERAAALAGRGFRVDPLPGGLDAALSELAAAGAAGVAFVLVGGGRAFLLTEPRADLIEAAVPRNRAPAWRSLDVTVAHRLLIGELWELLDDESTVGFAHDARTAVAAAERDGGTALLLNPTPVEAVAAVAAVGERMPRKSTLFTPKPRTGLLLRPFEA